MFFKNQSDFTDPSGCYSLWGRREGGRQHQWASAGRMDGAQCVPPGDPVGVEGKQLVVGSDLGSKGDASQISGVLSRAVGQLELLFNDTSKTGTWMRASTQPVANLEQRLGHLDSQTQWAWICESNFIKEKSLGGF